MSPLTFVSGILLGTAFSVFFGLAVVALLFALLGVEHPRVASEIAPLLSFSSMFLIMTLTSALGFIALVKKHPAKWFAQALMWISWAIAIFWVVSLRD